MRLNWTQEQTCGDGHAACAGYTCNSVRKSEVPLAVLQEPWSRLAASSARLARAPKRRGRRRRKRGAGGRGAAVGKTGGLSGKREKAAGEKMGAYVVSWLSGLSGKRKLNEAFVWDYRLFRPVSGL
jgi:hypothetical protein